MLGSKTLTLLVCYTIKHFKILYYEKTTINAFIAVGFIYCCLSGA